MPEALELDIGDLTLAALAWGSPSGRPILAAHGWLDNAATMTELAPRLCAALDLRIVSLDLPGHGHSSHKQGPYHFVDWVADLLAAADALGWERFCLLGHSMGAGISTLVAGTMPERIERCVLLEGIGPMTDEPRNAARRLARSLRVEARKRDSKKRLFSGPAEATTRLLEATKMAPRSAETLIARGLVEVEGGWTWRADPRLRIDSRFRFGDDALAPFLSAITCPVLLVEASEGWPHPTELVAARIAKVSNIEVARVEGRHHVHLDDAERVAAKVIPFLAPVVGAGKGTP